MMQNLLAVTREPHDYADFLRRFAVLGEHIQINDDEFDYIYYTYGLRLYGKTPLIEPLEYKEVRRIREFVIAIDTSGSVKGEQVQRFIQKTYNILLEQESFFTKINLHIVQCDAAIQEAQKITSREEFDAYLASMTLKGFGGTDFRPVFAYVDRMIEQREFTNLRGLIYFTDGEGIFPRAPARLRNGVSCSCATITRRRRSPCGPSAWCSTGTACNGGAASSKGERRHEHQAGKGTDQKRHDGVLYQGRLRQLRHPHREAAPGAAHGRAGHRQDVHHGADRRGAGGGGSSRIP